MAREAYPYLIFLGLFALLAFLAQMPLAVGLLAALGVFVAYFFRDPERAVPPDEGVAVAPADGRVTRVERLAAPGVDDGPHLLSIFLSPLDVHINRSPIAGRILKVDHVKGRFLAATRPESSLVNEQNVVTIEGGDELVIMKQIAGVIARRCVLWKQPGDRVELGERVGLIKFSSRTDIVLPAEYELMVKTGARVKGGVTIIARKRNVRNNNEQ